LSDHDVTEPRAQQLGDFFDMPVFNKHIDVTDILVQDCVPNSAAGDMCLRRNGAKAFENISVSVHGSHCGPLFSIGAVALRRHCLPPLCSVQAISLSIALIASKRACGMAPLSYLARTCSNRPRKISLAIVRVVLVVVSVMTPPLRR